MAEAVVEPLSTLAGDHQTRGLQQFGGEALDPLQMVEQSVPGFGGIAEPERVDRGRLQAPLFPQVAERGLSLGLLQRRAKEPRGQRHHPMQLLAPRQLLTQALLLGAVEGLDRQLVFARQLQHHLAEAGALQFHQELDGVATGAAGKAVIELLRR